ncbi:MAG: SMC-Scp complex subunit ScpB [Candidatus Moranbacteria bacterium]|nr:SMC-Scp complex subunit ScpB [Candidatus Moranbacteria bacterium]
MPTPNKLKSVLESLLFVSGEPLKLAKIAKICNVSRGEVAAGIDDLNQDYQKEERGFAIIRKDDSVQLATNPENSETVSQLISGELGSELSKSALEALAIVAYRGPITRMHVETIRGVNCSYVLRSLLIKGLIERKETTDIRGFLYEISFDFLKSLGITSVKDLPDWQELSKNEKLEELLSETVG